jgi:hypothetical protein
MKKIILLLFANLFVGNLILYFHEVKLRNQETVDPSLWIAFSLASLIIIPLAVRRLGQRKSVGRVAIISLLASFLIPVLGIFVAMGFSPVALVGGAIYLFYGFVYFVLPMWALNYFFFRWIQQGERL